MTTVTLQRPYVFLSYSRSEGVVAKRLEQDLRVHGFQVWRDVSSIDPGSPDWEEAVREGLSHAYAVVLIASPSVIQSRYIKGELSLARRYQPNHIYPVWVDGTDWPDCVPIEFITTEYIDMRGEHYEEGFKVLVKVLQKAKEQPSPLQPDIEPPAQPSPPSPPPRPFSKRLVLIVGLILLLILSSGIIYFTTVFQPNQRHAQATATARANQRFMQASATAQVQVIANASVIAANPNPYTPGSGKLALIDPLSDNSKGYAWETDVQAEGTCAFSGGAYHVNTSKTNFFNSCTAEATDFSNFAFEVQLKIVRGDCGGMIFRADNNSGKLYFFEVCQDGTYSFSRYLDFTGDNVKVLAGGSSTAITTGLNRSNTIAVVAQGSTLTIYVKKQIIASANDSTFSHGQIGVFADENSNPTEVAFNNAKVWVL
jgi:hypothetical protein